MTTAAGEIVRFDVYAKSHEVAAVREEWEGCLASFRFDDGFAYVEPPKDGWKSWTIAVVVMNGSNKAKESPIYNDSGRLVLLRASGMKLSKVAEAPIGHWSQGVAFAADGRTILVGNMVEKDLWVFEWNGTTLRDTGQRIKVNGGSAAVRTAEK